MMASLGQYPAGGVHGEPQGHSQKVFWEPQKNPRGFTATQGLMALDQAEGRNQRIRSHTTVLFLSQILAQQLG